MLHVNIFNYSNFDKINNLIMKSKLNRIIKKNFQLFQIIAIVILIYLNSINIIELDDSSIYELLKILIKKTLKLLKLY